MGIKIFSKNQEKTQDFQILKQARNRIKDHTDFQANTGQETETTYSSLGFPSGVTSSVVQDYTPNNHRSGVTNILN